MNARLVLGSVSILVALVAPTAAEAAPLAGSQRPAISVVDAWGRTLHLAAGGTKPVLVVYEDEGSAKQNLLLKQELAVLAKGGRYRTAIVLLPVADVGGYDYWPVRGFVKDAIQSESRKIDAPIYCDWDRSVRRRLGMRGGTSNVVLYDKNGKVVFAHEGALSKEQRETLINLLRSQITTS